MKFELECGYASICQSVLRNADSWGPSASDFLAPYPLKDLPHNRRVGEQSIYDQTQKQFPRENINIHRLNICTFPRDTGHLYWFFFQKAYTSLSLNHRRYSQ